MVEEKSSTSSFLIDFVVGGAMGAVAKTVTAPIERLKILFQTQDAHPKIRSGEVPRYTSIISTASRIYQEQGLRAFWRGNLVNVLRYYPTQAFNFAFKDVLKDFFPRYSPRDEFGKFFLVQMASGMLAGLGSLIIVYPLDLVHTRLAADVGSGKRDFNGIIDCISKVVSGPRGIRGLYIGFAIAFLPIIPYRMVYFGFYDTLREFNPWKNDTGTNGLISRFAVAQTVTILAALASYPINTVVARLQMQAEKPIEESMYKGLIDCTKRIAREEGIAAFWKGAGVSAGRTIVSALTLVAYDYAQTALQQAN